MRNILNKKEGFIALMSTMIISAILMALLFSSNMSSFNARFDALDSEYKRIAEGLAESCVNQALLKLGQNYNYQGSETIQIGVDTQGRTQSCVIKPITPSTRGNSSTIVTIKTQGVYVNTYSDFQTTATLYNPTTTIFTPTPTCYLWTNTNSIMSGQSATLGWNTSNAAGGTLKIIASNNSSYNINSAAIPSSTQSVALTASETFVGTVTTSAGSSQCTTPVGYIAPSIIVQPPATCADTAMIFDRSGSLSNTDLSNERNAGNSLLTLYQNAVPQGQVAIGSFGAYPNQSLPLGAASIPTNGQLSKNWSNLSSILTSITGSNSSVGSNLAEAIRVAANELSSIRHDPSKSKVLIFVSDGEPNEPTTSSTIPGNTGFLAPTTNAQNGSGDVWTNPSGAQANAGAVATDTSGHRERYATFNFPTIPAGATIKGITVNTDTWSTLSPVTGTISLDPNTIANYNSNSWTTNTGSTNTTNKTNAVSDGNSSTYITATASASQTYKINTTGIPVGATINSVSVNVTAQKINSGTPTMSIRIEKGSGAGSQNDSAPISPGSTLSTFTTATLTKDPFTNNSWTIAALSTWGFGINKINSTGTLRVTEITVTVNYTVTPTSTSCQLGVDLSWNGSSGTPTWTTEKIVTLPNSETTLTLGSATDDWSTTHTWIPSEFTNTNFRLRIHDIDPDPGNNTLCPDTATTNVDFIQAQISFTTTQALDPTTEFINAANIAKTAGVEIFTVRYSSNTNSTAINLLKSIASNQNDYFQSPTTQAGISAIFNTIATQVCPAALPPAAPPTPPTPPPPPPPPPNIQINSWQEATTTN